MPKERIEDPKFEALKEKILRDTGFNLSQYSQDYVKRRLGSRMMALGLKLDDWDGYAGLIARTKDEYPKLFDFFSVNVTEFFRDPGLWKKLSEQFLPALLLEKRLLNGASLRIWSAGCSTGEEPYSLCIILKEMLPKNIFLSYMATDIDEDAIKKAQDGLYSKESVKNVKQMNPNWPDKYFTREIVKGKNIEKYRISPEIQKMVLFKKHNFLTDQAPRQLDMVLCRNAMIYISGEGKDKLLETFYNSLMHHGFLIVGKSELIFLGQAKHYFYPVDSAEHIYRKERRRLGSDKYVPDDSDRRKKWWPGKIY